MSFRSELEGRRLPRGVRSSLNTDLREMYRQPKSAMIGLTRGSKQSRYSDVIGVLCFGCDKMTSQSSCAYRKSNPDIFVMQSAEDRAE